jgi:hypothetical protein
MSRPRPGRLVSILALTLGLFAIAVQAQDFRYRYVSLDGVELPPGFLFFDPIALNDSGRVFGTAYECFTTICESIVPHVAVYAKGSVTALQPGFAYAVNERGTVGGSVLTDPVNFTEQAALFRGHQVELIPPQPGEFTSFVTALNDSDSALVTSYDVLFQPTFVLYKSGQSIVLDFGPTVTNVSRLAINNNGVISGTQGVSLCDGATAFRFDTRTSETTLLTPLATESAGWGLDVNNRGDVLGYSFVCGGIERIGVWDRHGEFQTYFTEGIPEFPTISNELQFNDNNLIVITRVSSPDAESLKKSYLVPKPGTRLNLADLVKNLPSGLNLSAIVDINNHGDMVGLDFLGGGGFLLERIGVTDPRASRRPHDHTLFSPVRLDSVEALVPPPYRAVAQ